MNLRTSTITIGVAIAMVAPAASLAAPTSAPPGTNKADEDADDGHRQTPRALRPDHPDKLVHPRPRNRTDAEHVHQGQAISGDEPLHARGPSNAAAIS